MINRTKLIILTFSAALILPVAPTAYADPPPWAPAHGWRKKHDPYYVGYSGKKWDKDYGIISGECNWQAIGTVLGGVVGGAVGASVGKDGNKTVAIIIGSVLGAVIGNQVGKSIDDNDRGCIGHSLELAHDRQTVRWVNPDNGINYRVTPLSSFTKNGRKCRDYMLYMSGNDIDDSRQERACLMSDGVWKPI